MNEIISIKDHFDTELERLIDFILTLHQIVSMYGARQTFDMDELFGYRLGESNIEVCYVDNNENDWDVWFSVIDKTKEKALVEKTLAGKLKSTNDDLANYGWLRFRVLPDGDSRWEVVGSTIPVYGRSQVKEPREFIVNVDEDDIV